MHAELKKLGITISEKVILRIMREENLVVPFPKRKHFNSYMGELTPAVENLVNRDFHANKPNEKWPTDITEFSIPAGKVYLSPVIDCFDGLPISWAIHTRPTEDLANSSLLQAISTISTLRKGEHPMIHTDRGGHYRWYKFLSFPQNIPVRELLIFFTTINFQLFPQYLSLKF